MSSSNSSEMKDQIVITFLGVMDEVMSIVQAEEVVATAASSSSNSSEMKDQIVITFLGVMDEAMSIVQAEEVVATTASSSSNSSEMKDQIVITFLGVIDEAMSIAQAEEVVATVASSSTRWLKCARCYVNHDREAAHFRLCHDYFDDDCVYPRHTFTGGIVCG
jgi:cob(I)alamin adenosyltransferase